MIGYQLLIGIVIIIFGIVLIGIASNKFSKIKYEDIPEDMQYFWISTLHSGYFSVGLGCFIIIFNLLKHFNIFFH